MQITISELKKQKIWVEWKYSERNGKITKVPINASNGKNAKTNEPDTWNTHAQCLWKMRKNTCNGVGVMFTAVNDEFSLFGIDVDGHASGFNGHANDVLDMFSDTYCERSPSGTGYHIIGLVRTSRIPKDYLDRYYQKNAANELECYVSGYTKRYFTFTGNAIKKNVPVKDVTDNLFIFLDRYMKRMPVTPPKKKAAQPKLSKETQQTPLITHEYLEMEDILEIARSAKNGHKFSRLYDAGDASDYGDDDSRADLALCCLLAFYFEGDPDMIDEAFRESALYRPKWERSDYRKRTISRALEICQGEYFVP